MSLNPSLAKHQAWDHAQADASMSESRALWAINTLSALLRVNDALLRIARTISDRRRRASESNSSERWWPSLNRELSQRHIAPLLAELSEFLPTHGYDRSVVVATLNEAMSVLSNSNDEVSLPPVKTDWQLINEYLEPALIGLCESIARRSEGTPQEQLALRVLQLKPRAQLKAGAGRDLVALLEQLVEGEPRSLPPARLSIDSSMFGMPGVLVETTREEIDELGLCIEDALSFEDAWEAQGDVLSYINLPLLDRRLGWYECETAAKSVLLAASMLQQRIESKEARSQTGELSVTYFCRSCDELTEAQAPAGRTSGARSLHFCKGHARPRNSAGDLHGGELSFIVMSALQEAARDPRFKQRFFSGLERSTSVTALLDHTQSCPFCSGRALKPSCLVPENNVFPELFAYHANVRKVAIRLANSHHANGIAWALDDAAQRGESLRDVGHTYGLRSDKAIGQHSGLALARLLHQKVSGAEAAARLGISPSAVSQRRSALTGCFDFEHNRHVALRWWPFDDLSGADIIRFPTRALGTDWRHAPAEYEHLTAVPRSVSTHLRLGSSSSLATRSSARRWV